MELARTLPYTASRKIHIFIDKIKVINQIILYVLLEVERIKRQYFSISQVSNIYIQNIINDSVHYLFRINTRYKGKVARALLFFIFKQKQAKQILHLHGKRFIIIC